MMALLIVQVKLCLLSSCVNAIESLSVAVKGNHFVRSKMNATVQLENVHFVTTQLVVCVMHS